jgi:hypothetical protein
MKPLVDLTVKRWLVYRKVDLSDQFTLSELCQNYMQLCVRIGKIRPAETAVKRLNRYQ